MALKLGTIIGDRGQLKLGTYYRRQKAVRIGYFLQEAEGNV